MLESLAAFSADWVAICRPHMRKVKTEAQMAPLFCRNEGQRRTWGTAFKQCSIRIHRLVFVWQAVSIWFFYIVWLVVSQVSHIRPCTFPRVWGIENKSQRHHFLHGFLQPSKFQATPEDADRQDPKRQRALVVKCRVHPVVKVVALLWFCVLTLGGSCLVSRCVCSV